MNRVARFVWTFIGTAAMQKGPLWWAGHHVNHHRFVDREGDPHSPLVSGIWYVIRLMELVGLAWAVQPVPSRIYKEARVLKARRLARSVVSVVEVAPIGLELAEDID